MSRDLEDVNIGKTCHPEAVKHHTREARSSSSIGSSKAIQPTASGPRGQVYVMRKEEVEDAPNVVTCNFFVRTHPIEVLFDSGATHSFIFARLVEILRLMSMTGHSPLSITLPDGKVVDCRNLYLDCPIQIHGHNFLADLYKFELMKFDGNIAVNVDD